MLQLASVGRRFGHVEALRNVSLDIAAGDFMALLGPSGCGKSTLLRLIAGLEQPDVGSVTWDAGHAPTQGEIGFVFQDATLLPGRAPLITCCCPAPARRCARAGGAAGGRSTGRVGLHGFAKARPAAALRWDAHAHRSRAPWDPSATSGDGGTIRVRR
jgi:NitT/TauT family transport system ATP-binding protein